MKFSTGVTVKAFLSLSVGDTRQKEMLRNVEQVILDKKIWGLCLSHGDSPAEPESLIQFPEGRDPENIWTNVPFDCAVTSSWFTEYLNLRLVSEDHMCSGWLEVFYNGTWGSVCSNSMHDNTISVICRHLSCGAKGHIEPLSSPQNHLGARWIDRINCQGQESSLWHCPSQSWDQNSCQQGEEALITCEGNYICPFCLTPFNGISFCQIGINLQTRSRSIFILIYPSAQWKRPRLARVMWQRPQIFFILVA